MKIQHLLLPLFFCFTYHAMAQVSDWEIVFGDLDFVIKDGYFKNEEVGFVVGDFKDPSLPNVTYVAKTDDKGKHFEPLLADTTNQRVFNSIASIGDQLIAVGQMGMAYTSTDEGQTWQVLDLGVSNDLMFIRNIGNSAIWIAGSNGLLLTSTDQGNSWEQSYIGNGETINGFQFHNAEEGLCYGQRGMLFRTRNGGQDWENISVPKSVNLHAVSIISSDNFLAVGAGNSIFKTYDAGQNWKSYGIGSSAFLDHKDVILFPDGYGLIVNVESQFMSTINIYETFDFGDSWQLDTMVTAFSDVTPFANHIHYIEENNDLYILGGTRSIFGGFGHIFQSTYQFTPTSTYSSEASVKLSIYPNPANAQVHLLPSNTLATAQRFIVTDLLGHQVLQQFNNQPTKVLLDTRQLPGGLYILHALDKQQRTLGSAKFTIVH